MAKARPSAWDREVATLTDVMANNLLTLDPAQPPTDRTRDAQQAAIGVLLLSSLPDTALRMALVHFRHDLERRGIE